MPTIDADLDYAGRPLIRLYAEMSADESRERQPVVLHAPPAREVVALIDTGAGRSQLDLGIVEALGLSRSGEIAIYTASTGDEPILLDLYRVDLTLADERPGPLAESLEVVGSPFLAGLQVGMLVGRDLLLDGCVLTYNGPYRRFSLSYGSPPGPRE